jgi:nicotinamidase/pyrazinamidase
VEEVTILGLATDYCVKATALDAQSEGFSTTVVVEGCRAVNSAPDDGKKALAELQSVGIALN